MPIDLFDHDGHRCLMFTDLFDQAGEVVQSNQFLVVDDDCGAIIDPGGNIAYGELFLAMTTEGVRGTPARAQIFRLTP